MTKYKSRPKVLSYLKEEDYKDFKKLNNFPRH